MTEKSRQALTFLQQFAMKSIGPSGQEFLQFNAALQLLGEELNAKDIEEDAEQ